MISTLHVPLVSSLEFLLQYCSQLSLFFFFFFNDTATTEIYTLSLHDALPILSGFRGRPGECDRAGRCTPRRGRSEEHTSELQSRRDLVCRLLLEKKKKKQKTNKHKEKNRKKTSPHSVPYLQLYSV